MSSDPALTLSALRRGGGDPTHRVVDGVVWRTALTPAGPASVAIDATGAARAWGDGRGWALAAVADWCGRRDDASGFAPAHPVLRAAWRRHRGLRVPRTGLVLEALVPAVLEQLVTGMEARRSWRELLTRFGRPAPGPAPAGMRVFPPPAVWRRLPSWEWHRAGVDGRRARTIAGAAAVAPAVEALSALAPAEAARRLQALPGVGAWTAAEVAQRAWGDADAVSVGDLHLPTTVGWALAGRPFDDAGMLAALEPYRPHRYRVTRLLELSGRAPRFAPRYAPKDYRRY